MTIQVSGLHHFTIGCAPDDLPALVEFYTRTIGLQEGFRPALSHPGRWLYAGGHAVLHLNALRDTSPPREAGPVDHVAFEARGLATTRAALRAANVPFSEKPLRGTTLHQVFVEDPLGLRIELNFDLASEEIASPST